ncbi:MAG: hypothetical protein HY720_24765 [Planctomycetes bacterium]|nr:hypothetical protein [Planctomycetota bacterium]
MSWDCQGESRRAPPSPRECGLVLAALVGLLSAAYAPSLGGRFIEGWDDRWLVLENPHVQVLDLAGLSAAVDPTIDRSRLGWEYLPVRDFTVMIDHELWRANPVGHRLTSFLVHAATSFGVFLLLARILGRPLLFSAAGSVLFALHPLATEPVAWIADRKDALALFFFVASLLALASAREPGRSPGGRRGRYAVSYLLAALCVLSKSNAIALLVAIPLFLPLLPRLETAGESAAARRGAWCGAAALAPFLALAVLAGLVHFLVFRSGEVVEGAAPVSSLLATVPPASLRYLRVLLVPVGLSPHYRDPKPGALHGAALGILVAGLCAAGTLRIVSLRRRPGGGPGPADSLAFALLLALVSLAPALAPLARRSAYIADRYAYAATLGMALAGAVLLRRASGGRPALGLALAAVPAVLLGTLTYQRASVWSSEVLLWRDAAARDPNDPIARLNLGLVYQRLGLGKPAEGEFLACLDLDPENVKASHGLAVELLRRDDPDITRARRLLESALATDPRFHQAHATLAGLLLSEGNLPDAKRHIDMALSLDRSAAESWLELGNYHLLAGNPEAALAAYDEASRLAPGRREIARARAAAMERIEQRK